jgi:hypothetical protein
LRIYLSLLASSSQAEFQFSGAVSHHDGLRVLGTCNPEKKFFSRDMTFFQQQATRGKIQDDGSENLMRSSLFNQTRTQRD